MRRSPVFVFALGLSAASLTTLQAQDDVQARMQEWSKALGVECTHCHLDGQWDLAYLPTCDLAYRMSRMVNDLNTGALQNYGGISCNTCHQGKLTPPKITQAQWERDAKRHDAAFNGDTSLALQMGVFTASLGVGCSFCHDPNDWGSDDGSRPEGTASGTFPRLFPARRRPPGAMTAPPTERSEARACAHGAARAATPSGTALALS